MLTGVDCTQMVSEKHITPNLAEAMRDLAIPICVAVAATLVGAAAAFVRPAHPYQIPSLTAQTVPNERMPFSTAHTVKVSPFIDDGLDNPRVETDDSINPARKCSVCIGVSPSSLRSLCRLCLRR